MLSREQVLQRLRERVAPSGDRARAPPVAPDSARAARDVPAAAEVAGRRRRAAPDPRQPLRPCRPDGRRRRPAADASGGLRLRRRPTPSAASGDLYIAADQHQGSAARRSRRRARRAPARRQRAEGRIIRILERAQQHARRPLRHRRRPAFGFVVPFDRRVLADVQIPPGRSAQRASPARWSSSSSRAGRRATRAPLGRIIEVLGDIDEPGVDTAVIIRKHAHARRARRRGDRGGRRARRRRSRPARHRGPHRLPRRRRR